MITKKIKNKTTSFLYHYHKVISFIGVLFLPVFFVYASGTGGTGSTIPNPLGPTGPSDIPTFLGALFKIIAEIGAVVLAFYIVYTGYLFVTAQGNEQALQKAKESLKWVLIGGAIILGASVLSDAILKTIQDIGP
ncbi:MAG: hypothetical protein KAI72_04815 [Candidatus Pacebacteria bacterium]|nr:hypothetical protein [Candidatus Paceibacterota bacterium]